MKDLDWPGSHQVGQIGREGGNEGLILVYLISPPISTSSSAVLEMIGRIEQYKQGGGIEI